ncbi:putative Katanin p80 WD40 repeat-containing subunit B1 [Cocos nucifera]|uniref:Putative Katanin p80 WD40 repeat-containing subunit B1 n=1 Tax=Cocos nucifera TaxID=13894 RepID=A0A8K0INU4_COCNU|nr:putative Katanin p80 WD40 repeat-containing subunit B1 [Cocos nucifera]
MKLYGIRDQVYPSIDAMEFGSENLLVCGSDCEYGGPAVVQLWDIESPESCLSFPANDSYITSLKTNPACNTIITGAGDGTVGLFDIRTCAAINHLSVGSGHEVTSVSFSGCGTYFTASSTSNNTLVWDTRFLPMDRGQVALGASCQSNDMRFFRPLHCLSHGKQMPTAEHAGQLPGHVDEGDQGVNDARWLQREPVLVTVSGDGSMAMWNVALVNHICFGLSMIMECLFGPLLLHLNDTFDCGLQVDAYLNLYMGISVDGVSRLEEALEVNPRKHETLWCLGNAHTSHAFYTPDHEQATVYFQKAKQCFQQAVEEEPENELYLKSLDLSAKIYCPTVSGSSRPVQPRQVSKKKKSSDLKYDILGWVILAVGIVAWVGMAKSHIPPPSS